jgi:phosphate transport system protein
MNDGPHIASSFDDDLERLRSHVMQMWELVETQLAAAVEACSSGETENVDAIVESDRRINELEMLIDKDCAQIVAMRQPAASDMRLVLGIGKLVTDLERAGDEAKKIAKALRRLNDDGPARTGREIGVHHIGEAALAMLRQSRDAFARLDTTLAAKVIRADSGIDVEFKSIVRQAITHMMEDARAIPTSIDIINIARSIERIGDHAMNIAEQVTYIVEGRDIRHHKTAAAPIDGELRNQPGSRK